MKPPAEKARAKASAKDSPAATGQARGGSVAWWAHGLVVLGLLAAVAVLYSPTLGLGFFNLDDQDYILNNPYLSPLNTANLRHILSTPYFANYSPGHLLSYALDIGLAGRQSAWSRPPTTRR